MGPAGTALLSAGIGTSGGLLRGAWDTIWQNKNIDKTLNMNKELADYAYSKDLESWNRANEYNHPASQMARLSSAGLNPNMVYGKGATATSTATLPKYNAPTADYTKNRLPDLQGILGGFTDIALKSAQIDNVKANTDLNRQRGVTEGWNSLMRELTNSKERYKWLGGWRDRVDMQGNKIGKDYTKGERYYYDDQAFFNRSKNILGESQMDLKNDLLRKQMKMMDQQLNKIIMENRWMPWEKGVGLGGKALGSVLGGATGLSLINKSSKISKAAKNYKRFRY